jgi:uncharacterized protein YndB with AHSA1/START domain
MTPDKKQTEPLVIERTYLAPAALVWKALTDAEEMRRWYFDLKDFKPEAGFEFEFTVEHEGHSYRHLCKVTEAVSQKRLAYTWRYAGVKGDSLVTFELLPESGGKQTRLKLTHEGLETFPDLPAYARKNFNQGWTELVGTSLKEHVEKEAGKPGAAGTLRLEIRRVFHAPRELVWKAWTDPEHMLKWMKLENEGMKLESAQADLRVGGKFRLQQRRSDGEYFTAAGTYLEVKPPERLAYTWDWEKDGAGTGFGELEGKETRMTVELRELGKHTEFVLVQENFATQQSRDSHEEGWTKFLGEMAKYVEKNGGLK